MKKSHRFWLTVWYGKSNWIYPLLPLSWLFCVIAVLRKLFLIYFKQKSLSVPVIVVGNISVGGTGKTPLIIELVKYLQQQGHRPGVISRGYGGKATHYPYVLSSDSQADESGDEPLLIFNATQCAVCVAPDRVAAAQKLIDLGCTHILSDDGLQHYRLGRSLEIAVVDGHRLLGNGKLLPAGPLRESPCRLKSVDLVVVNNPSQSATKLQLHHFYPMHIKPLSWRSVASSEQFKLESIQLGYPVHAVAGIGNPERFFTTLDGMSLNYYSHIFADHHQFTESDFSKFRQDNVIMTEKDAVKCKAFANNNWYALIVGAQMSDSFWKEFQQKLNRVKGS